VQAATASTPIPTRRNFWRSANRIQGPFVSVNCGALDRELVQSALFGHRRGAFTGASDARRGAFLSAAGGTLFLDEIAELPLDVQPVLLRALDRGEIVAVGDDEARKVSVRIIAATHQDLAQAVRENRFREDLYHRIAVISLPVPPLRDRPDDIGTLALSFLREEGLRTLPKEVLAELHSRSFPGNVRQLRNYICHYAALGYLPEREASSIRPDASLRELINIDKPFLEGRNAISDEFAKIYLSKVLAKVGGNQAEAARVSGIDRTYLGTQIARHCVVLNLERLHPSASSASISTIVRVSSPIISFMARSLLTTMRAMRSSMVASA
jgi:transcriptional regulator with GAF, ATPase, and Fis domain